MTNIFDSHDDLPEQAGNLNDREPSHAMDFNAWPVAGWFDGSTDRAEEETGPAEVEETDFAVIYEDGTVDVMPDTTVVPEWIYREYCRIAQNGCWTINHRLAMHRRDDPALTEFMTDQRPDFTGWIVNVDTGELTPPLALSE